MPLNAGHYFCPRLELSPPSSEPTRVNAYTLLFPIPGGHSDNRIPNRRRRPRLMAGRLLNLRSRSSREYFRLSRQVHTSAPQKSSHTRRHSQHSPSLRPRSSLIVERHFSYQTLGAVSPWIQGCVGKLSVEVSRMTKQFSTGRIIAGQAALVRTERRDPNARE
jgi:hypothetical protein